MKLLLIIYTLCGQPSHMTLVDGDKGSLLEYSNANVSVMAQYIKTRELEIIAVPADFIKDGQCTWLAKS